MCKRLDSIPGTSKSRSVDHGFTAPFDLDALRNKIEGRFESVEKLSKDEELDESRLKLTYIGRNQALDVSIYLHLIQY
ncbi:hypothetical protein ALC62_14165 [Cyphomyrmex costatus]|uniref:Uncharacterized protein n=1 Tax=Cyphomyrmex costatus TaxID=456900 RepID=A0A195C315_9HYME|nr:hypothetical protein ALC62_14165 [Cyphomyrmex costatus]